MSTNYKYACIIDQNGFYKDYVLINFTERGGEVFQEIAGYKALHEGEVLLFDIPAPANEKYVKPRWNGADWEETATQEEIEATRPAPIVQQRSDIDIILLAIDDLYKKVTGGAA